MRRILTVVTGEPVASAQARFGGFEAMIETAAGAPEDVFIALDAQAPNPRWSVEGIDAIIVSGSPALLAEQSPWMLRTMAFLAEQAEKKMPILGICFGHQLLGEALGGAVARNPRGREIGTVELKVSEENPLVDSCLQSAPILKVNATHVDSIVSLPPDALSVATTELEPNAVVRFAAHVWGVQFHPEISSEIMACYVQERRELLGQEGLNPGLVLSQIEEAHAGTAVIANFLSRVV